jgi:hypothetical protein
MTNARATLSGNATGADTTDELFEGSTKRPRRGQKRRRNMSDDAERQIQLMLATAMAGPEAVRRFREMTVEQQVEFMTDLYDRMPVDELRKLRQFLVEHCFDEASAAFVDIIDCRLADLDGRG